MGYDLHRWLIPQLPPECTPLERAVAVHLAIRADDRTRKTWVGLDEIALFTGATEDGVRTALKRLARKGFEMRDVIGIDKHGKPLYAVPGKKLSFTIPRERAVSGPPLGTDLVPVESQGRSADRARAVSGPPKGGQPIGEGGQPTVPKTIKTKEDHWKTNFVGADAPHNEGPFPVDPWAEPAAIWSTP